MSCERVTTAGALVEALGRQGWDVAIADYAAPDPSAPAVLSLVRERDPDLPFIFVSDTLGEAAAVAAIKLGADDYIMKGELARLAPAVAREMAAAAGRRARRREEQRLAHLAYHDALTDLPNRMLLHDRLEQAVRAAHRDNKALALLVIDLDGFKAVNDAFGHQAGDRVLQQAAARMRATLREADTVARLGGDEFALVLPFTDLDGALRAASKVLQGIERPCVVGRRAVAVGASIGVACFPEHGASADALLQKADCAMYVAKTEGLGVAVHAPDRDRHTHARLSLIADLRQAIEARQLAVEYEPIVHLRTGVVVGVEALARWNDPVRGYVRPAEFLELAEETGLINPLTMFVLERALEEWSRVDLAAPLPVSINLSPRTMQDPDLIGRVAGLLAERTTAPGSLALEVTEDTLLADPARSIEALTAAHDMGVRLIIDAFGTGYSSLSYLRRLPVDAVKIDRSLVAGLGAEDEVLVRSTIDLAHNLGLTVIGDGVESDTVHARLAALGCDAAQGPFVGAPADIGATRDWISRQNLLGLV